MLVGREAELRQLTALLDGGRRPLLFGEAGVGKTALARAAAEASGRRLAEAGALSTLSWLPFLPFRRLLGHQPVGDSAYVAAEVERAVGRTLLFVDDLHWADGDSLEVVSLLAERVALVAAVRRGDPGAPQAVEALGAAGFELLPIDPLADQDAAELVAQLRPGLPMSAVEALVRRSGGNPLLLEELAASGEPTESLRLSLAARLRHIAPAAREAIGLLALAGRPLDPDELGPAGTELVDAGLAVHDGARTSLRHALLGETLAELLDDDERRRLHALLAERLSAGEAARHYAAAGQRTQALDSALAAAEAAATPGERASHLEIAAECAGGAQATSLRLEAARALAAAGRYEAVERLLGALAGEKPLAGAEAALLQARGAAERDDVAAARALLDRADTLAAGTETPIEHRIAVQRLELDLATLQRDADDIPRAAALLATAGEHGWNLPFALSAYAAARSAGRDDGWAADFARAIDAAEAAGEIELECRSRELLGSLLVKLGRPGAREAFDRGRRRSRELNLLAWERRFETRTLWVDFHSGRFRDVFEGAQQLLAHRVDGWERFLLLYLAVQSAADLGRFEHSRSLLDDLDALATENQRLRQAWWARADLELWAGRSRAAVAAAERVFELFPGETSAFVRVTHAWALADLGEDPGEAVIEPDDPFLAGVRPELNALWHARHNRWDEAAAAFAHAEIGWRGQHARGELRCAWAAGDALRAAGRTAEAVDVLLAAERRAEGHGHAPLLARVRRSLRAAGMARASGRGHAPGGLSRREREVLALVGGGLTNGEIARRLGVTRRTVETIVASACRKLDADSRGQAAALAARA